MDLRAAYIDNLKLSILDLLGPTTSRAVRRRGGGVEIEEVPEDERDKRLVGRDWPANGMTMIGLGRMDNIQYCIEDVISNGVPGDLIEAGVWRGGATIFMRGLLEAYGDSERQVWVADSFEGVPPPDPEAYPQDANDPHHTYEYLRVSKEQVQRNFTRHGLLDDRVHFLEGSFRDTLPTLVGSRWSVVRIDGDMYESTMVALESLYPDLSDGGYVILDDYSRIPASKDAVDDFRSERGIATELRDIDTTGVFWRKGETVTPDVPRMLGTPAEFTREYWEDRHRTWADTHWLGVPVQQLPLDLWALQEILGETRPQLLLETGTKFGGSALFMAGVFDLLGEGRVITTDIDQSRVADPVGAHERVEIVEGDSVDPGLLDRFAEESKGLKTMAVLDSDHHAEHVLGELEAYGPLISEGCYLIVQDTIVNGNPILDDFGPGPGEAVQEWLPRHPEFEVDRSREKFMSTFQPGGYLRKRVSE